LDRAVELGAKIAELRKQLAPLELELKSLLAGNSPAPVESDSQSERAGMVEFEISPHNIVMPDESRRGSVPERILAIMKATPWRTFSPSDFEPLVKEANTTIQNIRSSLIRLAASDPPKIVNVSRGVYRLPPATAFQGSLPNVAVAQK
jgi:hypothetical protein